MGKKEMELIGATNIWGSNVNCASRPQSKLLEVKKCYWSSSTLWMGERSEHSGSQILTVMVTEAFSPYREIQEVPSCAGTRKGLGLSLVWLPGVWAVVEAGETMCREMIKDPLGSSQTLAKCFPGSKNTSKLVMKLACQVKKSGPERGSAESSPVRTTEQAGSASILRVAHKYCDISLS